MFSNKDISFLKLLLVILIVVINTSSSAQKYSLSIKVTNIKKAHGLIEIGIFTDRKGFPKAGKQKKKYVFRVNNSPTDNFKIKNIEKGEYAIAIYHDKNTDGECNSNLIGMPKEPYGFSNNYKPLFKAPNFKDCVFSIDSDTTINIKLVQ